MLRNFSLSPIALLTLVCTDVLASASSSSDVLSLRTQHVGSTTYFRVTVAAPADLRLPNVPEIEDPAKIHLKEVFQSRPSVTEELRFRLSRLPRLIPRDERTCAVYFERAVEEDGKTARLEFVGKVDGKGQAWLLFSYPTKSKAIPPGTRSLAPSLLRHQWGEYSIRLDFGTARALDRPEGERKNPPAHADLQGCWAAARAEVFSFRAVQAPEFGYYGLARRLIGRKYHVAAPALRVRPEIPPESVSRNLYETTTGAAALTESLALRRLWQNRSGKRAERTQSIATVPGITIAEHPWEKMMAGKKPAPEPLAHLVPHDQYYLAVTNIAHLIELGESLDEWGTNALYAYEMTSRDCRLRQRYERQLCLKSGTLAKKLGPLVVRGVAITGSDPYFREGTDVSILFEVANRPLFLAAVQPFLEEARAKHGADLRTGKESYEGVTIESFVTPRREVSLYRAWVENRIIYSNSPAAMRRILDTAAGRRKALAVSGDFRYMRTVFARGAREEDAFVFLPDAFIRTLVGPASKIKEKRRLEALTSLTMMTHGALFAASETGFLPADRATLLKASGLKPAEVAIADGKDPTWDVAHRVAVSDTYNTIHFATPLIELPIDKVTEQEAREYGEFRQEYIRLWRRYFDPVGLRIRLGDEEVRLETYILPLIRSSSYNDLRRQIGGGTTRLDLSLVSPRTLVQYLMHLSPGMPPRYGIGEWTLLRLEDGPEYRGLAEWLVKRQLDVSPPDGVPNEDLNAFLRLPLTFGIQVKDQEKFTKTLHSLRPLLGIVEDRAKKLPPYKGTTVKRIQLDSKGILGDALALRFSPTFYHAFIDDAWYISTRVDPIRDLIDRASARRDGKAERKDRVEVNSSLYLAPEAAFHATAPLSAYLEWETFRRAMGNGPVWQALHEAHVIKSPSSDNAPEEAYRLLGFVPVSPDGTAYAFDKRSCEVLSVRHGSHARPKLHDSLDERSPVRRLLNQLTTIRADLRFREDGVQTVLTIKRKKGR